MTNERVQQNATFLTDLLAAVRAGRLVPAAFQRPYVWGPDEVEAMWKSLLEGWPLGSFLVWEPPSELDVSDVGRARLGPSVPPWASRPDLVLDGQNRLASFAWSLAAPDASLPDDLTPVERDTWASGRTLVADPGTRSVRFVPEAEARRGARMPSHLLVDSAAMWKEIRGRDISDDDLRWLMDTLDRRVREARVVVTSLWGFSPERAVDAFRHVAKVGVPMSDEDLEAAFAWAAPGPARGPGA